MSRIVVIGAGVGGLACGALLAKSGYEVEVCEKNSFFGGRCGATKMRGFTIDNFVHAFTLGSKGPLAAVAAELGEELEFIVRDPAAMMVDGLGGGVRPYPQRLDIRPLGNRMRMALDIGVKKSNLLGVNRLLQRMLTCDDEFISSKDTTTVRDFLLEYSDDPQLHRYMSVLSFIMFTVPYNHASAGEFIYCFREMFNAASFGYVKGSSGAIPLAYRRGLEKYGGRLHLGKKVRRILSESGKATGVLCEEEIITADAVISNAGINSTVDMAGAENLGEEYEEMSMGLHYSDSYVMIKYILDKAVIRHPLVFYIPDAEAEEMFSYTCEGSIPRDTYIFMPVIERWDPDLVPEGKQLVIAGTAAPNRPAEGDSHAIIKVIEKRIFSLFPDFEQHVTWREEVHAEHIQAAAGHPRFADSFGLAQVPGQVGADKPPVTTPLEGLYLVGTDAGARGVGTEQAAASAQAVAELVRERYPV
jgi:phytoene dehydrogenase-like protein